MMQVLALVGFRKMMDYFPRIFSQQVFIHSLIHAFTHSLVSFDSKAIRFQFVRGSFEVESDAKECKKPTKYVILMPQFLLSLLTQKFLGMTEKLVVQSLLTE